MKNLYGHIEYHDKGPTISYEIIMQKENDLPKKNRSYKRFFFNKSDGTYKNTLGNVYLWEDYNKNVWTNLLHFSLRAFNSYDAYILIEDRKFQNLNKAEISMHFAAIVCKFDCIFFHFQLSGLNLMKLVNLYDIYTIYV